MRLKDVGRVELGAEDYSSDLQFNGQDAVGIGLTQLSTANALEVDRAALAELERLSQALPARHEVQPGLRHDRRGAASRSTTCCSRWRGRSLLVILVIFVFLEDWRSTLIPAATIPVSLIGTFAFVKLLGFSINTLTLFGITLATGLVVDDAIVVIENIERHIAEGERDALQGRLGGDERGHRRRDRDLAGAGRGVRAGGASSRARPASCTASSR